MKDKDFMLETRNEIVKKILRQYPDLPPILHEKNHNGTSSGLVVDEIVVMSIRETIKTIYRKIGNIDYAVDKVTLSDYRRVLSELNW